VGPIAQNLTTILHLIRCRILTYSSISSVAKWGAFTPSYSANSKMS
jgi:hypothetical protein